MRIGEHACAIDEGQNFERICVARPVLGVGCRYPFHHKIGRTDQFFVPAAQHYRGGVGGTIGVKVRHRQRLRDVQGAQVALIVTAQIIIDPVGQV